MKRISILLAVLALAAGMLGTAAPAPANPPDCVSPDGTPCVVVDGDGVSGTIPGGPSGTAGPEGATATSAAATGRRPWR